jgi:opacity protein-like surface antigen
MKSFVRVAVGIAVLGMTGTAFAQGDVYPDDDTMDTPSTVDQPGSMHEEQSTPPSSTTPTPYGTPSTAPMSPSAPDTDVDVDIHQQPMAPAPISPAPVYDADDDLYEAPTASAVPSGIGFGLMIGGGLTGFTAERVRDATELGGGWNAELIVGTRSPIAFEAAYIGTANQLDALGLDGDAVLLGTGLSGVARVNFTMNTPVQPYVLAGAGWKRYDVTNENFNTTSVNDSDDVLEIPLGAGLSFRQNQFIIDARGLWRAAVDSDLIAGLDEEEGALHNWTARVNLGFEF